MTARRKQNKASKPRVRKQHPLPKLSPEERADRDKRIAELAIKRPIGRPPKYETADEMRAAIDEYFQDCETSGRFPTVAGMQYHIRLYSNTIWDDISKRGEDFRDIAKAAQYRMQDWKFQAAASGMMNSTIFIVDAVNNHGYVNTRTESKNDNRNSGRLEIEAIAISLVRPDHTQPIIDVPKANPQISANDIDADSDNASDTE